MKLELLFQIVTILVTIASIFMLAASLFSYQEAEISAIRFSALGNAIDAYEICVNPSYEFNTSWFCNTSIKLINVTNDSSQQELAHTLFVNSYYMSIALFSISLIALIIFLISNFLKCFWKNKLKMNLEKLKMEYDFFKTMTVATIAVIVTLGIGYYAIPEPYKYVLLIAICLFLLAFLVSFSITYKDYRKIMKLLK